MDKTKTTRTAPQKATNKKWINFNDHITRVLLHVLANIATPSPSPPYNYKRKSIMKTRTEMFYRKINKWKLNKFNPQYYPMLLQTLFWNTNHHHPSCEAISFCFSFTFQSGLPVYFSIPYATPFPICIRVFIKKIYILQTPVVAWCHH